MSDLARSFRRARAYGPCLALALASVPFALVCVEIGLRVYSVLTQVARLEDLEYRHEFAAAQGRNTRLGDIIGPSSHRDVLYELIPGAETVFKGRTLLVNEAGFRGRHHPVAKSPRTVRIVVTCPSLSYQSLC